MFASQSLSLYTYMTCMHILSDLTLKGNQKAKLLLCFLWEKIFLIGVSFSYLPSHLYQLSFFSLLVTLINFPLSGTGILLLLPLPLLVFLLSLSSFPLPLFLSLQFEDNHENSFQFSTAFVLLAYTTYVFCFWFELWWDKFTLTDEALDFRASLHQIELECFWFHSLFMDWSHMWKKPQLCGCSKPV